MSLLLETPGLGPKTQGQDQRGKSRRASTFRPSPGLMNRLAAIGDGALAIGAALLFQAFGPDAGRWLSPLQALVAGLIGAVCLMSVLGVSGSYRSQRRGRLRAAAFDIAVGLCVAALADWVLFSAFAPRVAHTASWLLLWTASVALSLLAARGIGFALARHPAAARWLRRRVAVVGAPDAAAPLQAALAGDGRYHALGGFDGDSLDDLRALAEAEGVDLIVIAARWDAPLNPIALAGRLQWISADIFVLLDDADALGGSRALTDIAGRPALVLHRHPLKGAESLLKLAQDYAVAAIALVLVSPVLLAAAIALKLAGGGPVLFRQSRIGFNGRPFTIYKFRTMRVDPSDDGSRGAVKGDPRCTRLGALFRKTSIDELPQLFNVLRGEMSIVGPRPHVANMQVGDGAYAEMVRAYAARHQIKPGVTGWAQINGMRGGIHSLDRAREGVELDLFYIRNWSLWLDLRIILATAFTHLTGPSVF